VKRSLQYGYVPRGLSIAFRVSLVLVVACAMSSIALAEPRTTLADGASGKIEFSTYTPASQRPLITRTYLQQPATVISAILSLPADSAFEREGRVPAVILMHGTGGVSEEREHAWAKRFNSWGIAALIVDSFTGRGIKPPIYAGTPGFTHFVAHLTDAYLALKLLATHPRIDGTRVAVMGFSRGGEVAVNAPYERFRNGAIGQDPAPCAGSTPGRRWRRPKRTRRGLQNAGI
jgi:acetyl esterase/lipase